MTDELQMDWQVPPFEASAESRQSWVEEQIQEGEGFLSGQSAYTNLPRNLNIFDAIFSDNTNSTLISNGLKYDLKKFVETISEVREIGSYSSDAKQFKPYAEMLNKVAKGVYTESQFPRQVRKALQFGMLGRGYLWPKIKAGDYGFGERKIVFEPVGMLDVVPVQIPSSNDVMDAYAVTMYEYMPIAEAHGRFPLYQADLKPVSAVSYRSRLAARRADYAERFRYGQESRTWGNLYCEIRYTFIRDIRINTSGQMLPMGDPGTSWYYEVPSVGMDIFGGVRNGQPYMRKALNEDCRIYPYLREIISTASMKTPMYDGPAFDWHGCIPAIQYDPDDWAWEAIGRSLIQSVGPIEVTLRKHERKIDQVLATRLNPPMGYDRGSTGGPRIENFDLFKQDQRVGVDGEPTKILQSLLPDTVDVGEKNFKFIEYLAGLRESQLGIKDLGNLENLKANIASQDMEKVLEPIGPIAKGIAAGMEASNAKAAYMLKFMILQWYDTKRVIEFIGADKVVPELFDYDPDSMIPSHMPDEMPVEESGAAKQSAYAQVERARRFAKNVRLVSIPSTLLRITQVQEQLKYLQLKKMQAPISWNTVLKKVGVENVGDIAGNTEFEKFVNEEKQMILLKAEAAALMAKLGLTQPEGPGQGKGGGRPSSGKKPPSVAQKGGSGGEPRTVLKES